MINTRNILGVLGVSALIFFAVAASYEAKADAYIGTSVFTLDTDVGDFRGVDLNLGYRIGEILELRGSVMLGAQDETYEGVSLSLEQKYGIDLIVNLPLSDTFNPYLLAGNTWLKAKASYHGYSATEKDDFVTFGAGLRFDVREAVSVYTEYKDVDGSDVFAVGLTANF